MGGERGEVERGREEEGCGVDAADEGGRGGRGEDVG